MTRFLVTYHNLPYPDLERVAGDRRDFRAWAEKALGAAMVDFGAPLFVVGQLAQGAPGAQMEVDGYSIVEARSASEVRALLEDHPFLALGATIQINECLEV
ncbi:hypothetical protein [Sinomonas atrocyanea]|jgi:hypothetical protein|uniref:hypothetical protein n=1 Tax=Sinomonas atrocyanea TaxID=37927 RepID=UPI002784ED3A|nr:hypothetical protein [Sinomonas atrocyanea]MDQ0259186.1 hypothetical protein [Sinomonas atrocyanea]MDR6622485.1 hypothetical protein [Sinomonas atrocyanea]